MQGDPRSQLRIAVCDDDPSDRRQIAGLTREILQAAGLSCAVSAYSNGTELLEAVRKGTSYHILLLDVMMDALGGMDLAAALRRLGDSAAIVFISSNRELAMRGYEVAAVRYLAKPIQPQQLREPCCSATKPSMRKRRSFCPPAGGGTGSPIPMWFTRKRWRESQG